ncbi:histone Octamer, chromosomal Protein, alpha carbons only [Mycena leptocephala]|nr:histone Octamer, chromosomal Protein, alpha carbons only [Mycena leptocephala]
MQTIDLFLVSGVGTKPTFKRLARRGGVKRISMFMYEELRGCLFPYIQGLLRDTMLHTKHDYRTTVTAGDVVHALRQSGRILYGFAT